MLPSSRFLFALCFELEGEEYRSQVVWIASPPAGVRLAAPATRWIDARAGDVMIRKGVAERISAVRLYSTIPSVAHDCEVRCGQAWIEGI